VSSGESAVARIAEQSHHVEDMRRHVGVFSEQSQFASSVGNEGVRVHVLASVEGF
jgi:hypothetical protein